MHILHQDKNKCSTIWTAENLTKKIKKLSEFIILIYIAMAINIVLYCRHLFMMRNLSTFPFCPYIFCTSSFC